MARVNLRVPFSEKDKAKALGACWDAQARVWYVPDHCDLEPFGLWLPVAPGAGGPDIRANHFYIAESERECWKCRKRAPVYAFVLPRGHEVAWVSDDSPLDGRWVPIDIEATLNDVDRLCEDAASAMSSTTLCYRPSRRHDGIWENHCMHCDALFGTFYDHCEPEGAFCPVTAEAAARITLREYRKHFEANAGHGHCLFFEAMTKCS